MNSNEEYLDSLLKSIEQKEAALQESETSPEMTVEPGQNVYADEVQNLDEEEIMRLLQQSSEESDQTELPGDMFDASESDAFDLHALLDNMSENEDAAQIQDLFEKAENNEPVSSEVEDMILQNDSDDVVEGAESAPETKKKKIWEKNPFAKLFSKRKKSPKENLEEEEAATEAEAEKEVESEAETAIEEEPSVAPDSSEDAEFSDISDLLMSLESVENQPVEAFDQPEESFEQPAELGEIWEDALQDNWGENLEDIPEKEDTYEPVEEDSLEDIPEKDSLEDIPEKNNQKRKKKNKKEKTDKTDKTDKTEKTPGFFSRLLQFLTEEDETEENPQAVDLVPLDDGVETLGITSDENQEVLAQLAKEDQKGKKKKKKKGKKGEKEEVPADADNLDEDEKPQETKKKQKKPKKEKKEKAPKMVDDTPTPKLSQKKVSATFLFAFTVMAAILVCCLFIPELFELKEARNAYYEGDYETCYRSLYGKKLSESDQIMYERSEFMMGIERRMDAYDSYCSVGDELRALDVLIQSVGGQREVLEKAGQYGLTSEAETAYQEILQLLNEKYQLTEEEILKICAYRQDALYTLHLKAIVAGETFIRPDYLREDGVPTEDASLQEENNEIPALEDVLPAEEELTETELEEGTTKP